MRLGTKLTLYLSLIIILVLSGYGYLDILSRRDILLRKMKAEVRSTGRTLEVSLEKILLDGEMNHVQGLIDALNEEERNVVSLSTTREKTSPFIPVLWTVELNPIWT